MHVRVATVQVQPEPESAVTVRPAGGVSVTVTVPLVGEPPTFVTLTVKVTGCPGRRTPLPVRVFASVRSLPATAGIDFDRTVRPCRCRGLNPRRLSPPLRSRSCPTRPAAITAVTVISG